MRALAALVAVSVIALAVAGVSSGGYHYCAWTGSAYDLSTGTSDDMANGSNCSWWLAPSYMDTGAMRAGVGAVTVWPRTRGAGVEVALLDTGVDLHWDYLPNLLAGRNTYDRNRDVADHSGHGTVLASIIAAAAGNGGYVGVAPDAKLLPVKIMGGAGGDQWSDAAATRGVYWALAQRPLPRVLNMSFGGSSPIAGMPEALAAARRAGVLVVIAAGNDGVALDGKHREYPDGAGFGNTVTVGNASPLNSLSFDSNYGAARVQVAAPGSTLFGDYPDGGYGWVGGSSAAAAVVSGVAALLFAAHPQATAVQVRRALIDGATRVPVLAGKVQGGLVSAPGALAALDKMGDWR